MIRRLKTYTAQTGFVYQYYFVGQRDALPQAPEAPAIEYVFDVTQDRKTTYAISVFLGADALEAWTLNHGRSLTHSEKYAAAKMRLFQGFDDEADLLAGERRLLISPENIEVMLGELGLE